MYIIEKAEFSVNYSEKKNNILIIEIGRLFDESHQVPDFY